MAKRGKKKVAPGKEVPLEELTCEELTSRLWKEAIDLAWLRVTNIGMIRKIALIGESKIKHTNTRNAEREQVKDN